jgi:hypothetical protein
MNVQKEETNRGLPLESRSRNGNRAEEINKNKHKLTAQVNVLT